MTTIRKMLVPPPVEPVSTPSPPWGEGGGEGGNPVCTFCGSPNTALESLFGSQLIVSQFRCRDCHAYFEAVREGR